MATKLSFSIDGAFLTGHSRNLVIEGRWDHAMRTLIEGLEGMTSDIAIKILKGDAKLVGVNDIDLADDDDAEYKAALAYQFDGVFVDSWGVYLRPYAVVTAWGQADLCDEREMMAPRGSEFAHMKNSRGGARNPLHYADDPRTDVARNVNIRTGQISKGRGGPLGNGEMVISRAVTGFPHLIMRSHGLNGIEDAVQALMDKGVTLREVGASEERFIDDRFLNDAPVVVSIDDARSDADRLARVARVMENMKAKGVEYRTRETSEAEYRAIIVERAGDDVFDLPYRDGDEEKVARVPTAPFENWALWRTSGADLAKPWATVCPSGLKMQGDDPYHTDWMVGAGLPLDKMWDERSTLKDAAYARMWDMQESLMSFEAPVLCGDQDAYGTVVHPKPNEEVGPDDIAVIPTASARYLAAAVTARGVIVEQGGAMAHLITVSREKGVTIMRCEDARKRYPTGSKVLMKPLEGKIKITNVLVRDAFGEYNAPLV